MASPLTNISTTFDSKKIDYASTKTKRVEYGTATLASGTHEIDLTNVTADWVAFASVLSQGSDTPVITTVVPSAGKVTVNATGVTTGDGVVQYLAIEG
jgi:hypothetical protein